MIRQGGSLKGSENKSWPHLTHLQIPCKPVQISKQKSGSCAMHFARCKTFDCVLLQRPSKTVSGFSSHTP
jgi:hypothetical protein